MFCSQFPCLVFLWYLEPQNTLKQFFFFLNSPNGKSLSCPKKCRPKNIFHVKKLFHLKIISGQNFLCSTFCSARNFFGLKFPPPDFFLHAKRIFTIKNIFSKRYFFFTMVSRSQMIEAVAEAVDVEVLHFISRVLPHNHSDKISLVVVVFHNLIYATPHNQYNTILCHGWCHKGVMRWHHATWNDVFVSFLGPSLAVS